MVFQEPRLLPWRSVEDNVRLAAPDVDERRLAALFSVLELSAHREHFPGELSLGLARRVALARAFAVEPDFLILDEPLASLDDALAARLRDEIAALVGNRPMITLLVTHSLDDAVRLGDKLILLSARPARLLHTAADRNSARGTQTSRLIAAIKADIVRLNLANSPGASDAGGSRGLNSDVWEDEMPRMLDRCRSAAALDRALPICWRKARASGCGI